MTTPDPRAPQESPDDWVHRSGSPPPLNSAPMPQQGPTVFSGRYELHRKLARGGMAEVFLARDQLLDRPVAIKVLFPEFATNPEFVERFRREAQAAANLSHHPNIVSIYDWGEERGTYFIVMEYVEGRSLADILRAEGRFHPDRAAEIAVDVLAALDVAHHAGLVHRDIKPGNIIVSPNGQAKVADFGIATATAAFDSSLTQAGTVMGTATYFSPEQAQGRKVDGRSDLYSLGVVLYEMLVGEPPFNGDTPVAIAYKHVQEEPVAPSRRGVSLPPSLEAITLKAMAKNPAVRYPTASDFASDLRRYRSGQHQLKKRAAAAGAAATGAMPVQPSLRPQSGGPAPAGPGPRPGPQGPRPGPPSGRPAPGPRPPQGSRPPVPEEATRVNPAAPPPSRPASNRPVAPRREGYYDDDRPRYDNRGRTAGFVIALVLLLIVLVALVMAFGKTLGLDGDDTSDEDIAIVDVPSLIDLPVDQAQQQLIDLGLVPELVQEPNEDFAENIVFDQDPPFGTRVEEGTTVIVRYSGTGGLITLPSLVGIDATVACDQVRALELEVRAADGRGPRCPAQRGHLDVTGGWRAGRARDGGDPHGVAGSGHGARPRRGARRAERRAGGRAGGRPQCGDRRGRQ